MTKNAQATKQQQTQDTDAVDGAEMALLGTAKSVHIAGVQGSDYSGDASKNKALDPAPHSAHRSIRTGGERSSAVEHSVHIGVVTGSIPVAPTKFLDLLPTLTRPDVQTRFWAKVHIKGPDDCWVWTGAQRKGSGYRYGHFKLKKWHTATSARCAFAIGKMVDPGSLSVLHHCDNPLCCNPAHLYLGTQADNNRDTIMRGRCPKRAPNFRKINGDTP
jgi:hypothetical protein